MRRQLSIVRAGEPRDAHRLGDAAADREIGLHDIDRPEHGEIAKIMPGEFALAGRDRNIRGAAHLRLAALIVGGNRLLEPGEVVLLDQAAETLRFRNRERAVRVAHQSHFRPQRLARGPHAARRLARVAIDDADPLLARPDPAARDIAEEFVADLVRSGPAARRVGRHFLGAAPAQEPPYRYAEGLAENVPQRAIDAADRRYRDATTTEHREDAAFPQRVVGARAGVEHLPQPRDVARVFAFQQRREFVVDHAGQRLVLPHAANLRLRFAPARQAAFGVDAYQGPVE